MCKTKKRDVSGNALTCYIVCQHFCWLCEKEKGNVEHGSNSAKHGQIYNRIYKSLSWFAEINMSEMLKQEVSASIPYWHWMYKHFRGFWRTPLAMIRVLINVKIFTCNAGSEIIVSLCFCVSYTDTSLLWNNIYIEHKVIIHNALELSLLGSFSKRKNIIGKYEYLFVTSI